MSKAATSPWNVATKAMPLEKAKFPSMSTILPISDVSLDVVIGISHWVTPDLDSILAKLPFAKPMYRKPS